MKQTLIIAAAIALIVGGFFAAGIRIHYVASASMEPAIPMYSLVVSRTLDAEKNIETGDIVIFSQRNVTMPVMHRVVELGDGYVITKGDANSSLDSAAELENVTEKVMLHVPLLGYFIRFVHTPGGSKLLAAAVAALLIMGCLPAGIRRRKTAYGGEIE